jgi:DNA-binding NtrC family response regulator
MVGNSSEANVSWLAEKGLAGTACSSGFQALDLLKQNCYQAVLCNFRMPGMDGVEFLSRIRKDHPDVAFVMVTEPEDVRHGILAMISGASDYIHTPLEAEGIVASLNRALRRKRFECLLTKAAALAEEYASPAASSYHATQAAYPREGAVSSAGVGRFQDPCTPDSAA